MSFAIIARMKKPTDLNSKVFIQLPTQTDTQHALVYIN